MTEPTYCFITSYGRASLDQIGFWRITVEEAKVVAAKPVFDCSQVNRLVETKDSGRFACPN